VAYQGNMTVCFSYPNDLPPGKENKLKLFHYEDTDSDGILDTWVNATTSLDTVNDIICATVTTFSPFTIFVENQVPVSNAGVDQIIEATGISTNVTLNGSLSSDPDGDTLTYTWTGQFGEVPSVSPTIQLGVGVHTITLTVDDDFTGSATDTVVITVQDTTQPVVSDTTATPDPVAVYTQVALSAAINDAASNIDYAEYSTDGAVTWSSMDPISVPSNSVTVSMGMPGFADSSVLRIHVRGVDEAGNTSEPEYTYLPVYDPSDGFVTGGGWIWSPLGAYTPSPELEGKANFGFVAKYKKGANTPTGNTEFRFKAGDLNFHSDSYDWLVVAGSKAMFKGIGTINGGGANKFMLTAEDGDLKNNGAIDTFRIRIWEEDVSGNEVTIYDNQMGEDPDADATTELGGGSIIIHKKK
jgi:hypothetical protein